MTLYERLHGESNMSTTIVSMSPAKTLPAATRAHTRRSLSRLRAALLRLLLCACCAPAASDATANVVISTTRAIVDLPPGDTTVRLRNTSLTAALVQVWVDTGDDQSTPDTSNAPFELTPSLFVLEAGQTQTVRLHYDGEPLPGHNERLYWFNMLDVPSREEPAPPAATGSGSSESNPGSRIETKPDSAAGPGPADAAEPQNELNFVLRTRIKLFLRPSNAPGQALNAPEKLVWTIHEEPGSGAELTVTNPTAFHVSCAQLVLLAPQDRVKSLGTRTFAPDETAHFALMPAPADADNPASNAAAVHSKTASSDWNEAVCHAINDYGSLDTFRVQVNHGAASGAANAGGKAEATMKANAGTDTRPGAGTVTDTGTGSN
jgi:chaperone protein EcpD